MRRYGQDVSRYWVPKIYHDTRCVKIWWCDPYENIVPMIYKKIYIYIKNSSSPSQNITILKISYHNTTKAIYKAVIFLRAETHYHDTLRHFLIIHHNYQWVWMIRSKYHHRNIIRRFHHANTALANGKNTTMFMIYRTAVWAIRPNRNTTPCCETLYWSQLQRRTSDVTQISYRDISSSVFIHNRSG